MTKAKTNTNNHEITKIRKHENTKKKHLKTVNHNHIPFDIHYSLLDLPAMPMARFEVAP